ncbi:serine/threonine-protein phosphatase 2A 56 kDa regulatory subunit epsilon isoform-like [Halyomorpha halys]|uniref:serine/threonine-protein phosphatase 2A 56 kDa regulatory subunit epsilon isoform-like n=1 Tax=Halyomorpha halys TaxID=286706 RepID=UPI0034D1FC88
MSSTIAYLSKSSESFDSLEDNSDDDDFAELGLTLPSSEISLPRPISIKKEEWISEKIKKCMVICDFKLDPIDNIEEKTEYLDDLLEFFQQDPGPMSRDIYGQLFDMFSINLCRKVPQSVKRSYDPEEDSHTMEEAWPHLKLVYEIFIKFLELSSLRLDYSKIYMSDRFLHEIMELMDSDDPREKDMAKTVVHRIYARFCTSRPYLRKELCNILLKFIYDTEFFSGISEILEIFSCIINGLSLPLSEEFVVFLSKVLVPLHKVKNLSTFLHPLTVCLVNFLHKDTKTFKIIIEGLIKYWPKTNSQKQVQFLSEIEEMFEAVDSEGFGQVLVPLFSQLSKCVLSSNFQVVERSLSLYDNPWAWHLIKEHYTMVLPVLMPSLLRMRRGHWNQTVAVLVNNVLKKFKELDPPLFENVVKECLKPPAEPKKPQKFHKFVDEDGLEEGIWSSDEVGFESPSTFSGRGDEMDK